MLLAVHIEGPSGASSSLWVARGLRPMSHWPLLPAPHPALVSTRLEPALPTEQGWATGGCR